MGCDIHSLVEVKKNGKWKKNTKKIFPNSWYKPEEKLKPEKEQWEWALEPFNDKPSDNRHYDWFAILADVRNGKEFAGVNTSDGFSVIAEPKGKPEECSDEFKTLYYDWGEDLHSVSYLNLDEFDNFDWNQKTTKYGVISLERYKELKGSNNSPGSWSGSIWGANIITVDQDTANQILNNEIEYLTRKNPYSEKDVTRHLKDWNVHVEYTWVVTYSEWFKNEHENIIEPMRKLKEEYEDVRLIFGFDN